MIEALKIIGIVLGSALATVIGLLLLYVLFLVIVALCVNPKKEYTTRSGFYEGLFSLSVFLVCKLYLKVTYGGVDAVVILHHIIISGGACHNDHLATLVEIGLHEMLVIFVLEGLFKV